MKRTRISLTVLVEQEVPRPPIDCPKSRRGADRADVADISSAFRAGSAEDLADWL
jgi:hypothetical protein